jgi:glycosyltransferase involved in cell wall biosynthesis
MRLFIVQYAGDYRETFLRFQQGGQETYYAQKYSVDVVAQLAKQCEEVTTLCLLTQESYNEVLEPGLRAIGAGFRENVLIKPIIELLERQQPTHLVIRTPIPELFQWAIKKKVKTLATLADSFRNKNFKNKVKNYFLTKLLNHQQIEWIGNHGIDSCLSLRDIGVNPNKLIPWDWIHEISPESFSPKNIDQKKENWDLIYVGSVVQAKGVGDILEAVSQLKAQNVSVKLKIVGGGDRTDFQQQSTQLQISDRVEFTGLVPNHAIIHLMREADLVLIPSRHEYPEGFPMTIYEALCSRTPIVASDHPMFQSKLKHEQTAAIFPAGNSEALANCIKKLLSDPPLYRNLSVASSQTWKSLQIPVKWADLIDRWLDNSSESQAWLFNHRLSSGIYRFED